MRLSPTDQASTLLCLLLYLSRQRKKKQGSRFAPYRLELERIFDAASLTQLRDSMPDFFTSPTDLEAVGVQKEHGGEVLGAHITDADNMRTPVTGLDLNYPGLKVVHLDPAVVVVENFFTEAECDEYLSLQSADASSVEYMAEHSHSGRTSSTWFVAFQRVPYFLARAAALLGVDNIARFESPQLVRYRPGEFFGYHYDVLPTEMGVVPIDDGEIDPDGGYRIATLLVYLTDVSEGGRTLFHSLRASDTDEAGEPLQLGVQPKKGSAILFFPVRSDGRPDYRTMHAGEPAVEEGGTKAIAQLWLHERPLVPRQPKGSSPQKAAPAVHSFAEQNSLRTINLNMSSSVPVKTTNIAKKRRSKAKSKDKSKVKTSAKGFR